MSYGVRNTIILLVVLTIFIVGGWAYIYFFQQPKLEDLAQNVKQTQQELNQKQQKADQLPMLENQFKEATKFFNNYNKGLYPNSNEDNVYDFLERVSTGSAYTEFTFSFSDSTTYNQYGVISMQVTGQGYYRNFINFLRQIELSKPLNKVSEVTVNPINELDSYGKVNYRFSLESFYDRVKLLGEADLTIHDNLLGSVYNPFYPFIRSVKENENNLVNVENSELLAISSNKIFLLDQQGIMQRLTEGDEVYLGRLSSIDIDEGTASFTLNKGGIVERITLQVNNDDEDENESSN
ncbi:type 4a pilus biogenesis protein PilO [Fodinibius sp.]|uniref:type 4a pilus biogenesis protein PilO n=1 Tax=Fodinibius sp. TaxID=1872440 RepID=UPI002ACEF4E5|nr:type 4a pilus biogenesis protein PilO [Fodinibius sp.]MDZ7660295.1 type 4a pilus biogenesis protein PilO [Fodinibius sp.]